MTTTLVFKRSKLQKLAATMSKVLSRDFHVLITSEYFNDWIEDGMLELSDSLCSICVSVDDEGINSVCESHTVKTDTVKRSTRLGKFTKSIPTPETIDLEAIAEQFKC